MVTRNRASRCIQTISSTVKNCNDMDNVEIILGCDDDDEKTAEYILEYFKENSPELSISCKLFTRMGYQKLHHYFRDLINMLNSSSELILFQSDTIDILTKNWDDILLKFHSNKKFGAYFLNARKQHSRRDPQDKKFIVYAIPVKWVEITGRCSNTNNCDSWVEYVAREASCLYHIEDIKALHYDNMNDKTFNEIKVVKGAKQKMIFHSLAKGQERSVDALKIRNYIKTLKKLI